MVDLTAGDMLHSLTLSVPAEVAANGSVSMMAKEAERSTKVLPPAADVAVTVAENHWTTMACGRTTMELAGLPGVDYNAPKGPSLEDPAYTISGALLSKVLNGPLYAVGSDDTKIAACQLIVDVDDAAIESMATDGHRAAIYRFDDFGPFEFRGTLQLIRHGAQRLARLAGSVPEWTMTVGKDRSTGKVAARFAADNIAITMAMHTATPPPIRKVMPTRHAGTCVVKRDDLAGLVDVLKTALPKSASATLAFDPTGIDGRSGNREHGNVRSSVAVTDFTGDPVTMSTNALQIGDAISALLGNEHIKIGWGGPRDPVLLYGTDPASSHFVAPMKADAE